MTAGGSVYEWASLLGLELRQHDAPGLGVVFSVWKTGERLPYYVGQWDSVSAYVNGYRHALRGRVLV